MTDVLVLLGCFAALALSFSVVLNCRCGHLEFDIRSRTCWNCGIGLRELLTNGSGFREGSVRYVWKDQSPPLENVWLWLNLDAIPHTQTKSGFTTYSYKIVERLADNTPPHIRERYETCMKKRKGVFG